MENGNKKKPDDANVSRMKRLFGFESVDLKSWESFVALMNRPEDPSNLAMFRILFGLVMMIDIPHERGMAEADTEYGANSQCRFPLFDFIKPFEVQWMLIIYTIMFLGAFGICIGFKYRTSCLCFLIPYWYLFFLDKTVWNNHSYLYGLLGFQFLLVDANRFLSVDAMLDSSISNAHVPLWNYFLLRIQVFLVYFIAGIKKLDPDWVFGYSMENLGSHWVFLPFKFFLTNNQITLFIVHGGGLFLDLFVGFFLFFDSTRLFGTITSSSFHLMNSRMFSIGMFPYAMLATTTLFYSTDWPKRLANRLTRCKYSTRFQIKRLSPHCVYPKESLKSDGLNDAESKNSSGKTTKIGFYHKFFAVFAIVYLAEQVYLPYSHSVTKGYNNWTNGLYGYSWDMMIHSWHTQHIKISFKDKDTNQTHYINPRAWSTRRRWSSHADMIYQYSKCIQDRLKANNFTNIELYMDIWRSMNHRFHQRQIDPRVDLTKATWSAFHATDWLMPLLTHLSDWREKMKNIEKNMGKIDRNLDITFVADFPGLPMLENYISEDLNTTIEVLYGQINVEIMSVNRTLNVGDKMKLPSGEYHSVYTVSNVPSCYLYIYINETSFFHTRLYDVYLSNMLPLYNQILEKTKSFDNKTDNLAYIAFEMAVANHTDDLFIKNLTNRTSETNPTYTEQGVLKLLDNRKQNITELKKFYLKTFYYHIRDTVYRERRSVLTKIYHGLLSNLYTFQRSFKLAYYAIKSVLINEDFMVVLNRDFLIEADNK